VTLHEYGHHWGFEHPPGEGVLQPGPVEVVSLASYADVMHTGLLHDYETDRFYTDANILSVALKAAGDPVVPDAPLLPIPDVTPLGDPVEAADLIMTGKKLSGAGLVVNGQEVIPVGDAAESWDVPVTLALGVNRFDVAQRVMVGDTLRDSHPNLVYTTRAARMMLPRAPEIQFTDFYPASYAHLDPGQALRFTLEAKAAAGLREISWWVERTDALLHPHQVISNLGHFRKLYGSVTSSSLYAVGLEGPGIFKVHAVARDVDGVSSAVAEIAFTVGTPLSLFHAIH
jgi:hypothetical protein